MGTKSSVVRSVGTGRGGVKKELCEHRLGVVCRRYFGIDDGISSVAMGKLRSRWQLRSAIGGQIFDVSGCGRPTGRLFRPINAFNASMLTLRRRQKDNAESCFPWPVLITIFTICDKSRPLFPLPSRFSTSSALHPTCHWPWIGGCHSRPMFSAICALQVAASVDVSPHLLKRSVITALFSTSRARSCRFRHVRA